MGSIDKAFTKTAIEQLVARGKISLTDTIGKLLPDYPQAESRTATVDQLLHHSAGIADVFGEEFDRVSKDRFRSNADYYNFVSNAKPMFAPGARTQYCNGCYVVLGAIIERVSSMSYERYVEENIFKPAGMDSTGFLQADGINPDVAVGYTHPEHGGALQSNVLMNGAAGCAAGGGYSSTGRPFPLFGGPTNQADSRRRFVKQLEHWRRCTRDQCSRATERSLDSCCHGQSGPTSR